MEDGLLSEGKLVEALAEVPATTRTLILHCLAISRAQSERIGVIEEILYAVKKSYKLAKLAYPVLLPIGGFILARLVT